jgi:hypothetical protein
LFASSGCTPTRRLPPRLVEKLTEKSTVSLVVIRYFPLAVPG